jgi:cytochrome c peroxidase
MDCRNHYKEIESFLEYFFRSSATIYNRPPKFEAEEGNMEYQSPIGLQLIESLLYDPNPIGNNPHCRPAPSKVPPPTCPPCCTISGQTTGSYSPVFDVELIRIMSLDITGYEAPLLKSGIRESAEALQSLSFQLQPYLRPGEAVSDSLRSLLDKSDRHPSPAAPAAAVLSMPLTG